MNGAHPCSTRYCVHSRTWTKRHPGNNAWKSPRKRARMPKIVRLSRNRLGCARSRSGQALERYNCAALQVTHRLPEQRLDRAVEAVDERQLDVSRHVKIYD